LNIRTDFEETYPDVNMVVNKVDTEQVKFYIVATSQIDSFA